MGPAHLTTALPPLRNIATIAVFYALPVVQLVITYQTVRGRGLEHLSVTASPFRTIAGRGCCEHRSRDQLSDPNSTFAVRHWTSEQSLHLQIGGKVKLGLGLQNRGHRTL